MIIETVAPSTSEDANGKTAKQRNAAPRPKKQLPKTKKHDSNSEEDDVIILDADESFKSARLTKHLLHIYYITRGHAWITQRLYSFVFFILLYYL